MTRLSRPVLAVLAVSVFALAGCSDDGDNEFVGEDTPLSDDATSVACDDVWLVGETLPEDYEGCTNADGEIVPAVTIDCADDSMLTTYEDSYYANLGGEIAQGGADDAGYAAAYNACLG